MKTSDPSITSQNMVEMINYLEAESTGELVAGIIKGLTAEKKYISSRFFYDETGSKLFEDITALPEYYPTCTEKSILKKVAPGITDRLVGPDLIELGSGDCSKISLLLDAVPREQLSEVRYFPVDVSPSAIHSSAEILNARYPGMTIHGILADFVKHLRFSPASLGRTVCFFGSTLGNFEKKDALQFLLEVTSMLDPGDHFLLGLDMVKEKEILEPAYNDSQGVTASFNKNILNVVNHYAGTELNPEDFEHLAFYNDDENRMEMHLKAVKDVETTCPDVPGKIFIKEGETIHTENSHKYSTHQIQEFAALTGLQIKKIYTDDQKWFSLVHFLKTDV